ncbi:hypothetical protein Tco_0387398 [Tanacetum coccineum]
MLTPNSTPLLLLGEKMEYALEHSLSLLEFWGISFFDGWKLVHVGNRIKSVVFNGIILHPLVRSRRRERDHHMIHEIEFIRESVWMIGTDVFKESGEEHSVGKCHIGTFSHTHHSVGNVVGEVEGVFNGEAVENVAKTSVWMVLVSS